MRYQGSEAYSWAATEGASERLEGRERPSFEVVTGGGLDARAREGVSPQFLAKFRLVLVVAAALVAVGMARVALTSATVGVLQSNVELKTQIDDAQALNDELRIERSVLSSNSRISRIATQNYGMVLSSDHETITLDSSADEQDAQQDGSDAQADGEAAQTADELGSQADVA